MVAPTCGIYKQESQLSLTTYVMIVIVSQCFCIMW